MLWYLMWLCGVVLVWFCIALRNVHNIADTTLQTETTRRVWKRPPEIKVLERWIRQMQQRRL